MPCNVEEYFKTLLYADNCQNIINSFLSTDTSVVKFSQRSVQYSFYEKLLTDRQTDRQQTTDIQTTVITETPWGENTDDKDYDHIRQRPNVSKIVGYLEIVIVRKCIFNNKAVGRARRMDSLLPSPNI